MLRLSQNGPFRKFARLSSQPILTKDKRVSFTNLGKDFEKRSVQFFNTLAFSLEVCGQGGQRGDKGIDFRGFWNLPDLKLPVIGQCKSSTKHKISSRTVREFSGSIENEPNSLGILVSASPWTMQAHYQFNSANHPLLMCQVDFTNQSQTLVKAQLNRPAMTLLPKLSVGKFRNQELHTDEIVFLYQESVQGSTLPSILVLRSE